MHRAEASIAFEQRIASFSTSDHTQAPRHHVHPNPTQPHRDENVLTPRLSSGTTPLEANTNTIQRASNPTLATAERQAASAISDIKEAVQLRNGHELEKQLHNANCQLMFGAVRQRQAIKREPSEASCEPPHALSHHCANSGFQAVVNVQVQLRIKQHCKSYSSLRTCIGFML
jgi:hypothetical protein